MEGISSQSQRFSYVSDVDLGIDNVVTAAKDSCFDDHLVCILEVVRKEWVGDWLKDRLPERCLLYHPHVLKIYDLFIYGDGLFVIFEHPRGENLLEFLKRYKASEAFVRNLFQQLIFAIDYYHNKGIDGLDLTLERVSYNFETGVLKLIDFGFFNWKSDEALTLTLPYVAPEQLTSPGKADTENKAVDVWRCGVLLFCMLFRSFPFCPNGDTTYQEHILNILRAKWHIPHGEALSLECFDLLQRMLTKDPSSRISLSDIKMHPWYRRGLPDGVLQYKCLERPTDGLQEKVEAIRRLWSSE